MYEATINALITRLPAQQRAMEATKQCYHPGRSRSQANRWPVNPQNAKH